MNSKGFKNMTRDERLEAVLVDTFRGLHHCKKITKNYGDGMWSTWCYSLATFDFDELTRLVLSAHHHCVRAELQPNGPRGIKILLTARDGRKGGMFERHPDIREAIRSLYDEPTARYFIGPKHECEEGVK